MTLVLGLCCINNSLCTKTRTLARKYYTVEGAVERANENLEDLIRIMKENIRTGIRSFRMSSEILPRYTDDSVEGYPLSLFDDYFQEVGRLAKQGDIRLSFHPGQFVVLASSDNTIVDKSIEEIEYHCEILRRMGVSHRLGVCNIHVGGLYEPVHGRKMSPDGRYNHLRPQCKSTVIERWTTNYRRLSENARGYLTVENDEKSFNLDDCLRLSERCGVPVVYDTHHEECYHVLHPHDNHIPVEINLHRLLETWTRVDRIPMAHISNQEEGKRTGSHSEYITRIPSILFQYAELCPDETLYVDVEAKGKEEAVRRMQRMLDERVGL